MATRKTIRYPRVKIIGRENASVSLRDFETYGTPDVPQLVAEPRRIPYKGKILVYFKYSDGGSEHIEIAGFSRTTILRGRRLETLSEKEASAAESYVRRTR